PPGARNWLIGSTGHSDASPRPFGAGPMLPGGTEDSPGRAVGPQSLYLAQLAERLGPQALKAIGYDQGATIAAPAGTKQMAIQSRSPADAALGENLALD